MENSHEFAILHHTADSSKLPQLQKVNKYHRTRWDFKSQLGWYVGYHYFIERSGLITQCRRDDEEGAHTKGQNMVSLGIGLAGNFDLEEPATEQLNTLATLLRNLGVVYKKHPFPLHFHYEYSDTHCPGAWFRGPKWQKVIVDNQISVIQAIISWIKDFLHI